MDFNLEQLTRNVLIEKASFIITLNDKQRNYSGWWYGDMEGLSFEVRRGGLNELKEYVGFKAHLSNGFYIVTKGRFAGNKISAKHIIKNNIGWQL